MSQIDKVAFLPLLFWFWILFISFYLFIFTYFISNFFFVFRTRNLFLDDLIKFTYNSSSLVSLFISFRRHSWINFLFNHLNLINKKKIIFSYQLNMVKYNIIKNI